MSAQAGPTYAGAFECIGPACEDPCCSEWAIPVDRATYRRYQLFPLEGLGARVAAYVTVPDPAAPDAVYAQINPRASGSCPFFAADRLCDIQREHGGALLSATCSSYPRALNRVDGELEGSLLLSCPEAARNVLLRPDALLVAGDLHAGTFRTDNFFSLAENAPGVLFKPYRHRALVRAWLVDMLQDRARPLWQRVLLIGSLCQKLDAVKTPEGETLVPAIVADYRQILGTTWGAAEMEANAAQPGLKLNALLRLSAHIPQDASCGERFRQTYLDFIAGIAATSDHGDLERYAMALADYYEPYLKARPWLLENYLVNYVNLNLFPFGRGGSVRHAPRSIFDEYLLFAVQFFWLDGLLTGVAGCHAEAFADAHVIHTVQSFCREVEHRVNLRDGLLSFLREHQLDSLPAVATLLRP